MLWKNGMALEKDEDLAPVKKEMYLLGPKREENYSSNCQLLKRRLAVSSRRPHRNLPLPGMEPRTESKYHHIVAYDVKL